MGWGGLSQNPYAWPNNQPRPKPPPPPKPEPKPKGK